MSHLPPPPSPSPASAPSSGSGSGSGSGTVLVTGGAGYIGSHVVDALAGQGYPVIVVDDLSSGRADRLPAAVRLVTLDLAAPGASRVLEDVLRTYAVEAVVHLAGRKQVGESVARPAWYYRQNVEGLLALHDAMSRAEVDRLVFSSSAAVYGDVRPGPDGRVREDDPTEPISPYGQTKLVGEWLNRAAGVAWGLRSVNLRYFNVAGAARPALAERDGTNLIPLVFASIEAGSSPRIFGDDHPTVDGTCVRDFIDVRDLAAAHVAALDYVAGPMRQGDVLNVGTGRGASVAEVVTSILRVADSALLPVVRHRRPGDPSMVVADPTRIQAALGWSARHDLDAMVSSAWAAWTALADPEPCPDRPVS